MNETISHQLRDIARQPQNQDSTVVVMPLFDASLEDIQGLGGSVARSNHLGNDYPSNQAFVNIVKGASLNLYDRTTGVDKNYHPWMLIREGVAHQIAQEAPEDLLVPFFKPNSVFFEQLGLLPKELHHARTPAQLHYLSQAMLHPDTITFSEWILKNRDQILALTTMISRGYQFLDRTVDADGRVKKNIYVDCLNPGQKMLDSAEVLAEAVTTGLAAPEAELYLHKNELNLYLDLALSSLDPQNQRVVDGELWGYVLHGAGPDMIKYATGNWRGLSALHERVVSGLTDLGIPRKIMFGLVPTAELKLALPDQHKDELDSLAELLMAREEIKKIKKDPDVPEDVKDRALGKDYELREAIRRAVADSQVSKIRFDRAFSTHASHYDTFSSGPIYFPEALTTLTFRQLREINHSLGQIARKN